MNPASALRSLWRTSPQQNLRKIARRLRGETDVDVRELLESPKHNRPQRLFDYLNRYEAILARDGTWEPLDFAGKAVLEVGCGPLMGFGPLAVFLGCSSFVGIEPYCSANILRQPEVRRTYLLRLFKDLSALYPSKRSFAEFCADLDEKVIALRVPLADVPPEDRRFDIVLSNSTLEHLDPLQPSIARLRQLQRNGGRCLHLVDFGNHRATLNPFCGMYTVAPEEYVRRYGRGINLARASDVMRFFDGSGFSVRLAPYYSYREGYDERPISWWTDRYGEDELFLKAALVCE
jgi:SAM-dependent methyltransferase